MACRFSTPSHYLNLCRFIVNWILTNKLQWIFSQNTQLFIHEYASENIVCKMATILSRERWVKTNGYVCSNNFGVCVCMGGGGGYRIPSQRVCVCVCACVRACVWWGGGWYRIPSQCRRQHTRWLNVSRFYYHTYILIIIFGGSLILYHGSWCNQSCPV